MSLALDFYHDREPDHRGLTRLDLLNLTKDQLDTDTNFIDWLFPLDYPGSPYSPLLTDADMAEFQRDRVLQSKLVDALDRMLMYYRMLRINAPNGRVIISRADEGFEEHSSHWLSMGNLNYGRLTRMIESLTLCGMRGYACALCRCLWTVAQDYPSKVDARSVASWTRATSVERYGGPR